MPSAFTNTTSTTTCNINDAISATIIISTPIITTITIVSSTVGQK